VLPFFFQEMKRTISHLIPGTDAGNASEDGAFFTGKVAIITGASSGIGKAIALDLARRRATVILASRNGKELISVRDEIFQSGGKAIAIPTDVREEEACKSLVEETLNACGQIDILVNNAGISMNAGIGEVNTEVLRSLMETNFWGTVHCTKFALTHILERKGSIVGISSISGLTPLPGRSGYVASKHAMNGFLETLRVEYLHKELHVMLVHPGFTRSNIRYSALDKDGATLSTSPFNEEGLMSAERVAREVSLGLRYRKKNLILSTEGRLITWVYRRMPNLAERLIHWEMNDIDKQMG
jgi:short-subunit dehydrogenase